MLEKNKPPDLFLRRLKILPLRSALSVIERRSKPTSAVSKNIILMITTKLFCLFTRSARLFVAKRSSKLFYDVIIRVLKNQLGAVYARASSMFLLFILEFIFAVIYHFSIYVFSSLTFDTSAVGSGF